MENALSVVPAARSEEPLVARLLQLCLHDLSEWTSLQIGLDGSFAYPWLALYWQSPRRHPYLIRFADDIVGFALVREKEDDETADWDFQLAEFFILRSSRKTGVGAVAARLVLRHHTGLFEITYDRRNLPALTFWKQVIAGYDSSLTSSRIDEWRERYLFRSRHSSRPNDIEVRGLSYITGLRSSYELVDGLVFFGRMLDKIRLHAVGRLPPDYNRGHGFDGRACRFLSIDYGALKTKALAEKNDVNVLEWCYAVGRHPSEEDIFVFNAFMTKRGIRDDVSDWVKAQKEKMGLAHRQDLQSAFDIHDADEGRK